MQIEMDSYMKYNGTIASMNDHLGEIYGYSDVRDAEEAQLKYEKELAYKAIVVLQQKVEQLEKRNKEIYDGFKATTDELCEAEKKVEQLEKENEKLMREVSKLHIIQEEYGNHIENIHIIDDYQKTYFMSNKWLLELSDGKFVYLNELLEKNNQLENIRKEAIDFVAHLDNVFIYDKKQDNLLNILNKGSDKE